VASLCSCRPLQSLAEQLGATAHAAPLPWSSPETGLGTLLRISRQCSLHAALRSGSSGLPRLLPGLTTDSACAGRGGPSRSSASHRRLVGIAASESSTWSSALLRSTFLLPGPAHAGLLSWGRTGRPGFPERLAPSPLRQLCTFLRRTVARPLPAVDRSSPLSASGCHPEVLFRPRGISPPRRLSPRNDSQACCILQPTLGFATFHTTSRG